MLETIKDIYGYMKVHKKFLLAPIILIMLLLGMLMVWSQGSVIAPLIYTIF